jgi:hypothetical protein
MQDSNESQEQSTERSAPDFGAEIRNAQQTGDFDFVLDTAKKSKEMLTGFRDTVQRGTYPGRDADVIAQGLNFLDNMVAQAAAQIDGLKRAEKQMKAQMKAALENKNRAANAQPATPLAVVDPEQPPKPPEEPQPDAPAPEVPPSA